MRQDEAHRLLAIYIPLPPLLSYISMLRNGTAGSQRQCCVSFHGHLQHLYPRTMPCHHSCWTSCSLCRAGTPGSPVRCQSHPVTKCLPSGWNVPPVSIYLLQCKVKVSIKQEKLTQQPLLNHDQDTTRDTITWQWDSNPFLKSSQVQKGVRWPKFFITQWREAGSSAIQ